MKRLTDLREKRAALEVEIGEVEDLIVSKIEGLPVEDVSDANHNNTSYNHAPKNDFFKRYPGLAAKTVETAVKNVFAVLRCEHPMGAKLAKLERMRQDAEDSITTAGTHTKLAETWERIKDQFDIFDQVEGRRLRKVSTARTAKEST